MSFVSSSVPHPAGDLSLPFCQGRQSEQTAPHRVTRGINLPSASVSELLGFCVERRAPCSPEPLAG